MGDSHTFDTGGLLALAPLSSVSTRAATEEAQPTLWISEDPNPSVIRLRLLCNVATKELVVVDT